MSEKSKEMVKNALHHQTFPPWERDIPSMGT
jgi:hypothetical protein